MKDYFYTGFGRLVAAMVSFFRAMGQTVRACAERVVPLGYEDESGFHTGVADAQIH